MVGLMQIMIYLLCVYLVFKGVEIFQIAWMSSNADKRASGMSLGSVMIAVAVIAGILFIFLEESMAQSISDHMNAIPNLNR